MPQVPNTFVIYERRIDNGGLVKKKCRARVADRFQGGEVAIESEALLQEGFGSMLLALVPGPLNLGQRELWQFSILQADDLRQPYKYILRFSEILRRVDSDWDEDSSDQPQPSADSTPG